MIEGKRIVAVGGGKGGVGKSVVACNLAVGYAAAGRKTVLVDADLGAPNLHTLLGADIPEATVGDLLGDRTIHLDDLLVGTMVEGLRFAHGAAPILGVANPKYAQKQRLLREIARVEADVLVVDLGAGVSYNVIDFFIRADVKVVVVAPQITSMHNAYGFIKNSLHRLLQRSIAGRPGYDRLFKGVGAAEQKISRLFERVKRFDPRYIDVFEPLLDSFSVHLLGNMLEHERELNVMRAMQRMIRDFLQIEATVAGGVLRDGAVRKSVNSRRPFLLDAPSTGNAAVLRRLVKTTLEIDVEPPQKLRKLAEQRAAALPKERKDATGLTPVPSKKDDPGEGQFESELKGRERAEPRYPCRESVLVRLDATERTAALSDISRSGARLLGLPLVEAGAHIQVRIVGTDADWVWLAAEVRYFDLAERALGCRFEDVSESERAAVDALLKRASAAAEPLGDPAATDGDVGAAG